MSQLKRRHFLQFSGATLASIGLSQFDIFSPQAHKHHQVLAQSTGRKYALLIGINQYDDSRISALSGCLTDVEMQYNLLRYRYGFAPENIRVLTNNTPEKPTRNNILRAFETHLIAQAKPGDVAIFHFSGHGSLMQDPNPIDPSISTTNGTLVPIDCQLDNRNDIMGRTLFLLSKQLQTDAFTMVLDSCHSGGGTRGNSSVRSLRVTRTDQPTAVPSQAELTYQNEQRKKLGLSEAEFAKLRSLGIAKGVAIGSAQKEQLAVDAKFEGFHAGALTYLLTRYLWQIPTKENLSDTFGRLALITREVAADSNNVQQPIKEVAPDKKFDEQPVYQLQADRPNAEAVITKIPENGKIEFWLGGVSSSSLAAYQSGSLFSMIDNQGNIIGEIEQTGKSGLVGYGLLKQGNLPTVGTLLREKLRSIPSDLPLQVAISPEITANREELKAELAKISNIKIVEKVNDLNGGGVIIAPLTDRITQEAKVRSISISQPTGSIGLLTANEQAIAQSFGRLDETPSSIADRLRPQLKSLLARQFLRQVLNGETSGLKVDVGFKSKTGEDLQVLAQAGTRSMIASQTVKPLEPNSKFDISVTNQESVPIYMAALSVGDTGELVVLHPGNWDAPESAALVEKGMTTKAPIAVDATPGFFEIIVITSARPLRETLRGLKQIAAARGMRGFNLMSFDRSSRSTGESDETVVDFTKNITRDLTRGVRPDGGQAMRRGLDPKLSGIFSTVVQVGQ